VEHVPSPAGEHRDVVVVDTTVEAPKAPEKMFRFWVSLKAAYSKNVQTNPPGTATLLISLLRKLRPPVKLMQLSETTGTSTQPLRGLIDPEHTVMIG
jgi:hypothetical protein